MVDERWMIPLGIEGETGKPLTGPRTVDDFCRQVLGLKGLWLEELRAKHPELPDQPAADEEPQRGDRVFRGEVVFHQKNNADARQAGWSYIISKHHPQRREIERRLVRLARHRWMRGHPHYLDDLPPEKWSKWIEERFASDEPHLTPYVLLVGDPLEIPFRFQSMLSAWAYVGRLDFSSWDAEEGGEFSLQALDAYVNKVIENEVKADDELLVDRSVQFLAPDKGGDDASHYGRLFLAQPLIEAARAVRHGDPDSPDSKLEVNALLAENATLGNFADALDGANPALVFTVGHGTRFLESPFKTQLKYNGAIVCQKRAGDKGFHDFNFSVKKVPGEGEAFLPGGAFFQFACYGYGTPRTSDFANWVKTPFSLSKRGFVAALPKALLAHPQGPIAYIGHTDLVWIRAFLHEGKRPHEKRRKTFEGALLDLLGGVPVGMALEAMRRQRILYSAELVRFIDKHRWEGDGFLKGELLERLARVFILHNDAQNYLLLGDPAARVRIPVKDEAARARPQDYVAQAATQRPGFGVQMPIMRGDQGWRSSDAGRPAHDFESTMHLWAESPSALAPGQTGRLRIRASAEDLPSDLAAIVAADGAVVDLPDKLLRVPRGPSGKSFESAIEIAGSGQGDGWVGVRFEQRGVPLAAFRFPVTGGEGKAGRQRQSAQGEPLGEWDPSPLRLVLLRPGDDSAQWRWIACSNEAGLDYREFRTSDPREASRGLVEKFPRASRETLESLASDWSERLLPSDLREALAGDSGSGGVHLTAPLDLPWECLRAGGRYLAESGMISDCAGASPSRRLAGESWLVMHPSVAECGWCRELGREVEIAGWASRNAAVDEDELLSRLLRNRSDAFQLICRKLDTAAIRLGEGEGGPAALDSQVVSALLRWERKRPLLLLMACGEDPSLAGPWPEIASRCGAGASVTTRWPVGRQAVEAFTAAFANALARGLTLAESAAQAREEARNVGGTDWLSFAVQGDPRAQVERGRRY